MQPLSDNMFSALAKGAESDMVPTHGPHEIVTNASRSTQMDPSPCPHHCHGVINSEGEHRPNLPPSFSNIVSSPPSPAGLQNARNYQHSHGLRKLDIPDDSPMSIGNSSAFDENTPNKGTTCVNCAAGNGSGNQDGFVVVTRRRRQQEESRRNYRTNNRSKWSRRNKTRVMSPWGTNNRFSDMNQWPSLTPKANAVEESSQKDHEDHIHTLECTTPASVASPIAEEGANGRWMQGMTKFLNHGVHLNGISPVHFSDNPNQTVAPWKGNVLFRSHSTQRVVHIAGDMSDHNSMMPATSCTEEPTPEWPLSDVPERDVQSEGDALHAENMGDLIACTEFSGCYLSPVAKSDVCTQDDPETGWMVAGKKSKKARKMTAQRSLRNVSLQDLNNSVGMLPIEDEEPSPSSRLAEYRIASESLSYADCVKHHRP